MAITMAPFYNVQGSVGSGGTNSRSDVMLVQYMLWHICIQTRPNWDRNYVWTPFDPDGVHGPQAIFPCEGSTLLIWINGFGASSRRPTNVVWDLSQWMAG